MSISKATHRSPLDFLSRKSSKSRQQQTSPAVIIQPPELNSPQPAYPESPILHTGFRTSVATTAYSNATYADAPRQSYGEMPPSPSLYSVDPFPDSESSLQRSGSSTSARLSTHYSSNYSRPTPPRTPESERAKRDVINRVRMARSSESLVASPSRLQHPNTSTSDLQASPSPYYGRAPIITPSHTSAYPISKSADLARSPSTQSDRLSPGPSTLSMNHLTPPPLYSHRGPISPKTREQLASALALSYSTSSQAEQRNASPTDDVYDRYSFYELPSPSASLSRSSTPRMDSPVVAPQPLQSQPSFQPSPQPSPKPIPQINAPKTAEDYLTMGIEAHMSESSDALPQSAKFFEISANLDGGTPFGMLMWGLCLRHGWGVQKDEKQGFIWLRQACEIAVGEFEELQGIPPGEKPTKGTDFSESALKGVKAELVLAIYEVGQCFFQGWGVERDRTMGFNYFLLAARLGDVDAQQELGFCYSNGKGCKKDRKEAAKWYRAAAEQGASTVGLAWIYKDKLQ